MHACRTRARAAPACAQVYLQLREMLSERIRSSGAEWFHEGSTTPMWDAKKMPTKPEWKLQYAKRCTLKP